MPQLRRRRRRAQLRGLVVVIAIVFAFSCSGGGGCSGCGITPIPGGFPAGKRAANAGQVRVTPTAIATIEADPAAIVGSLLGGSGSGVISFPVESCGSDFSICCANNQAIPNCGPLDIDLTEHTGDLPRLVLAPQPTPSPNGELDVTIRARIKAVDALVIGAFGAECTMTLDTTKGSGAPDLTITAPVTFDQDATAGTTKIAIGSASVTGLESADYTLAPEDPLNGTDDAICIGASLLLTPATIQGYLGAPLAGALGGATGALCKACTTASDCAPFGTACTGGQCMEGSACLQELGLDGRLPASSLFASFSPSTTGGMDMYEVAGGYSTTLDSNGSTATGISLGLLGGMEAGGSARDMCGPPATEPMLATVPRSTTLEGNTYLGSAFDVGIGLHKSQLAQLAYGGYEGGLFCLTITHDQVSQLDTDTVGLLSRSLTKLVEDDSPMSIGLRPQSPPTITLGTNTFTTNGSGDTVLTDPLLDVKFSALEIDFFAKVDFQPIRVFTVVADVDLPIGMQVGNGALEPVLGDTTNAFTNLSVKNSEAVTETPAQLASLFPTLLGLVLPDLASALPTINLPSLGGLNLSVTAVTAIDDLDGDGVGDFLAIFANLSTAAMPGALVHTTVDVATVDEPDVKIARDPTKWRDAQPARVTLSLGAIDQDPSKLEFSLRLDHGTWTAWSKNAHPTLSPSTFWLPGIHEVEVRSRLAGQPATTDATPARMAIPIGMGVLPARGPGGEKLADPSMAGPQGCACNTGGSFGATAPFALVLALILLPMRRVRRGIKRLGAITWLTAIACLPGCSCGSHNPCGSSACMEGTLTGSIGRWTSIAGDDQRVLVATYDQKYGDLVIADATDMTNITYKSIDGVPDEPATYDPSTWRGGVTDAGPNVGAWTAIVLSNHTGRVAYQDRDNNDLKYAFETNGGWSSYVVDPNIAGEQIGLFAHMITDSNQYPTIAYDAIGVADEMGHVSTELRLARATTTDPQSASDWTISTVVMEVASCGGLCPMGDECMAGSGSDVDTCVTPTTDCNAGCGSADVCYNGACVAAVATPTVYDVPTGTGLFPSLVQLSDTRLAITYYDRTAGALVLGVETAPQSSQFTPTVLDGGTPGENRGMWTSAAVASDGTVHVAYQDVVGNEVMYTSWKGGTAGTPEVVDDGERAGDRPHPVGAAAAIYLVNDSPVIAYQDALSADVDVATRMGPGAWNMNDLASGPLLDGFFIAATTGHGSPVLAWDSLNPADDPVHNLLLAAP